MTKKLLYPLCAALLLVGCSQDEWTGEAAYGYLSLDGISLQSIETVPVTRAVESDLYIEIRQGDRQFALYEPGELPTDATVKVPVGTYTLQAYNAAYLAQDSWGNNERGEAAYYAETPFDIAEDATTPVTLSVPMVNFGVSLNLPEGFDSWFHNETFSVLSGTRSVQLAVGETAYFPYSEGAQFTYTLAALNQDNENNTDMGTYTTVEAGTVYTVTYSLPEGLSVSGL